MNSNNDSYSIPCFSLICWHIFKLGNSSRYNKFLINENTYDFFEGEYNYVVYAQTSSVNVDPLLANEQVEEGLLKVQLSTEEEIYYNPS